MRIKDIPDDYELITNSQDVKAIANVCGWLDRYETDFHCLFVKTDGTEIVGAYGYLGDIPIYNKSVVELTCGG